MNVIGPDGGVSWGRWGGYAVLAVIAAIPVTLFLVAGVDASRFRLEGAGGPLVAFAAGLLSFLSPCVLPLVPIYITHLAGTSVEDGAAGGNRRVTFTHATAFIAGLTVVFVTLGASAGLAGFFLTDHLRDIERGAGAVVIVFGALLVPVHGRQSPERAAIALLVLTGLAVLLVDLAGLQGDPARMGLLGGALLILWLRFSGFLALPWLARTFQMMPAGTHVSSYGRSAVVGGAFATGWTPCVGPILGGILTLAATSGEAWTGAYLLLAYSAGFSVPFLITGLAVADASRVLKRANRWLPAIEMASAVMMVGLGILLVSGRLTALNEYFGFADFNQGL